MAQQGALLRKLLGPTPRILMVRGGGRASTPGPTPGRAVGRASASPGWPTLSQYARAKRARRSLGRPSTMQAPGSSGSSSGMQRIVAPVSALTASSQARLPHQ